MAAAGPFPYSGPYCYLGDHMPHHAWDEKAWEAAGRAPVPLFISHRRLARYTSLKPALAPVAIDSGGFSELSMYGEWRTSPERYVSAIAWYDHEFGGLDWAATQDWMCEPQIINGGIGRGGKIIPGTHLSVEEHQRRTVANYVLLRKLWPEYSDAECPFMPPLQGYLLDEYHRCYQMYRDAGVRLEEYPLVGLGSVCRRQDSDEIGEIARSFAPHLALHGFGVKQEGIARYGEWLTTHDSLAWSDGARRDHIRLPGCHHGRTGEGNCGNCLKYALLWRDRMQAAYTARRDQPRQDSLFDTTVRCDCCDSPICLAAPAGGPVKLPPPLTPYQLAA